MNQLRVHLLGKLSARHPDNSAVQFHSQKEEELFCYLLVNRGRFCPREQLASLLWGDAETASSKKYLRTALWHLKSDLGCPSRPSGTQLIKTTLECIQLRRSDGLWVDIDAVEEASALMQRVSDHELSPQRAAAILETIRLYQGDFLEGWNQEWCLYERERFRQIYFRLIDRMMGFCEGHRDFDSALELGMRLLRQEPARECTHRGMMRLYDLAGDRCSAIRQFERCVDALREELGVRPSQITLELYEEIRTARGQGPSRPASAPMPPANLSLRTLLDHLGHVRTMIESIETQITGEIQRLQKGSDEVAGE
ncbi:MAG TPA: BTAD domain-containing putative transcriptional regulator [Vicinamibacterales bacterium]|nr:BTAD domain-containing putative transcriptional regulator [Vicinamibacterales bacterium]